MIELLSNVKSTIELSKPVDKKTNNGTSFETHLDNSISQQKSLKEELNQQKIEDTKKSLKELNKKIQQLKEEISEEINPELLASLENIVAFLQQATETPEIMVDSPSLEGWVSEMTVALEQNIEQIIQAPELLNQSVFQKTAFILEDINIQSDLANTQKAPQMEQVLMNVLADLQQEVQQDEIALDSFFKSFAEFSDTEGLVEISDEFMVDNVESDMSDIEVPDNIERIVREGFSSEFQSNDQQNHSKEQKFEINDFRTQNTTESLASSNVEESFTLENMDNESGDSFTSDIVRVQKSDTFVERSYAALSSAVSRVQVEALMQNVSGKISVILQDGGNELRMKLTPPELGQMKLSFLTEDGMMRGKIVVETPEAKMFFEQNINNLRESLATAGISLGSVDVELGSQKDFSEQLEQQNNSLKAVRGNNVSEEVETTTRRQLMDVLVDFTA